MDQLSRFSLIILLSSIMFSCATKKSLYRENGILEGYGKEYTSPQMEAHTSFLLVGNSGVRKSGIDDDLYIHLEKKLKSYSDDDYLIFLGDNIKDNVLEKISIQKQLSRIVELFQGFKGNKLIIPGEREWKENGGKGLEALEEFFEQNLKDGEDFQPEKGCPIEKIDVNDQIELIIVDSQWYLQDWDQAPNINDKCEIKTREHFLIELKDKIKKASHKTVLLAMHHPLYSNGFHSGYLPSSILLNPVSENSFVPIIGSISAFFRTQGGFAKQDRLNPRMNELMSEIETALLQVPRAFLLSGHEQALQYIQQEDARQIVSGTSSASLGAALAKNGYFSSGSIGFAELKIYEDGASQVNFYGLDDEKELLLLYSAEAFPSKSEYNTAKLPNSFPRTFKTSVYPKTDIDVSTKYEKKWGKHYRYVYGIEVEAPVAVLDTLYGGLKVERAGGGNQTLSLRLVDSDGKEYNMRALAKDPISFLQASGYNELDAESYFSHTMPAELISDFYTAAHPYGAFVIASLSHEIQIKHTHPMLYYVPKQKSLGNFNHEHGDKLYMIEQKPEEDFSDSHMFGRSDEVINTIELLEALRDDEKNQVDEEEYIRARIFDMLLGDWDRHEGQWSWARRREGEMNIYSPVPRDRDQVFANFDGKFLERLQKFMGRTRQFGKYGRDIEFVENFSESAINLDRAVLQRSDENVWYEQVKYIQDRLGNREIKRAFSQAPEEIKDGVWAGIQNNLVLRKANLAAIVARYLDYFLRFQTMKGTDKDDIFYIERKSNGDTHISAYRIKDGKDGTLLFDRVFDDEKTKNLWIYGLDDKDVFKVKGKKVGKMNMVIIGGLDGDTYDIQNGKRLYIYDQNDNEQKIIRKGGAKVRSSKNYENRIYNTEVRPSDGKLFGLEFNYNPDEGIAPKLQIGTMKMGFERNPFTSKYVINARYISLTQAMDIRPEVHFANLFARWNLQLNGRLTSNNYTENFFGFGNDSFIQFDDFDANRIFMQRYDMGISIYREGAYGTTFEFGTQYENIATEESAYVDVGSAAGQLNYLSAFGKFEFTSLDDEQFPTRGLRTSMYASASDNFQSSSSIWTLNSEFVMWNALDYQRKIVLKNRLYGQLRFGENMPFYKLATLGANIGLRSYRQNRFIGKSSLVTSADLSYKFVPLKTFLFPLNINSFLGYDLGRVWYGDSNSGGWKNSYGGGINMEMAGMVNFRLEYFSGREGGRFSFGLVFGL
ncbi:BamA/TamA family outer membrane protein [Pareuzebyella sediminis]|uniref:metallophosphoesterase n=1 Tax=Pareuzebyella sediminis TaxID=2607998 RepID=UPI0011EC7C22|nr:metallophosphoesterase [Pareuzebyella sediminis]